MGVRLGSLRVPGGRLVVVEYGALGRRHPLHRIAPLRWLLEFLEPFLGGFWRADLERDLEAAAMAAGGKTLVPLGRHELFGAFYRAWAWRCAGHGMGVRIGRKAGRWS